MSLGNALYWSYARSTCCSKVCTAPGNSPSSPNSFLSSIVNAVPLLNDGAFNNDFPVSATLCDFSTFRWPIELLRDVVKHRARFPGSTGNLNLLEIRSVQSRCVGI